MKMLNLFLNYSCNAKCGFCFNPANPSEAEEQGLSTEKAAWALVAGFRSGHRSVSFIGGEVTVRGDFIKLVAAARRTGYEDIRLVSNGLRLAEPGYVDSLLAAGVTGVDISLHSHRAVMHDKLLGFPGAFEKAAAALSRLKNHPIRLGVNIVINRLNYGQLPETVAALYAEQGIRKFSFFGLRYIGHMKLAHNLAELKVPMMETAPALKRALEWLEEKGCLESTCIGDFVPCALPGYEELITDWRSGDNPDCVTHPDGRVEASEEVCGKGKRPVAACSDCVHRSSCLGVEGDYLAVFGEGEFKPLREIVPARIRRAERILS